MSEPVLDRRWTRPVYGIIGLVVVATLIWGFALLVDEGASLDDFALAGRPAPSMELPYLGAEGTLDLDDLRGRIVVVNFWSSWCDDCRQEHPELLAAAEAYRDRGVVFLGILRSNDGEEAAIDYLDRHGWGESYLYVVDVASRASIEFGVFGQPETYFINADGIIVDKTMGGSTAATLAAKIDAMLQAGSAG